MKYVMFVVLMLGTACMIVLSGFVLPTMVALLVLVAAVIMDDLTTYFCFKKGGKEGNPVMAFLFRKIGIFGTFGVMACVWTLFIVFRWLPDPKAIQTGAACTYWLVPMSNLMVLRKLSKRAKKEA